MSHASGEIFFSSSMIRDLQAADEVRKLHQQGRYEKEIAAYGTVYWNGHEREYLISGSAAKIYDFLYDEKNLNLFPTPLEACLVRKIVPSGCETELKKQVKVQLARKLQQKYPKDYFLECEKNFMPQKKFYDLLLQEQLDEAEKNFIPEQLQAVSVLLEKAFQKKCVTEKIYYDSGAKINRIKKQMETPGSFLCAQRKTLQGFCMVTGNGTFRYKVDGDQETLYRHMDQAILQGYLVSPVLKKTYWYDYTKSLMQLRADFSQVLENVFSQDYMHLWEQIYREKVFATRDIFTKEKDLVRGWKWIHNRCMYE